MTKAERRQQRLLRERTIELMWEDGFTPKEIAETLETTSGTINATMAEMRREGKLSVVYA